MKLGDLIGISAGNLWRMKLRSFLTIAGVVIAIGAFVSMLSFGAGNRRIITEQIESFGLLFTMIVYPLGDGAAQDSLPPAPLDASAARRIAELPGVAVAYPFDTFPVTLSLGGPEVESDAQALPAAAAGTKHFSRLLAGKMFGEDAVHEVVIGAELLEAFGIEAPDSIIGLPLVASTRIASIDSGMARVLRSDQGDPQAVLRRVRMDSLTNESYVRQTIRRELGTAIEAFLGGVMAGAEIRDTLIVSGVLPERSGSRRLGREAVLIPEQTARRFASAGISTDPLSMFEAIESGQFFGDESAAAGQSYPRITLILTPQASSAAIADSLEAMGYRAFSFADEFEEMRKMFFYFDIALAAIGLVALITAALGIANTMVMSIGERRREIGILKSLGADERDVRILFLVESGVIGCLGSAGGILLGWVVARIASQVAQAFMVRQGVDPLDPFSTPPLLILVAFLFGIGISVIAGAYPAARAARVDPVSALRQE